MNASYCNRGCEQYEEYYSRTVNKMLVQYDYRNLDGDLFSCIASDVEDAREKRDAWLKEIGRDE